MLISLGLLLFACGKTPNSPGTTAGPGADHTTKPPAATISHPTGSQELVMRVSTGGGLVPIQYMLTHVPEFSLYGDGTVIVTGPVILVFPGPALPNLQTAKVSEDTIQEILSLAKELGLFANGVDYGSPGITDVATTTILINAEGTSYRADIYALGMEEGAGGLTMQQQEARAAIADLVAKLSDVSVFGAEGLAWKPYDFSSLLVFSTRFSPQSVSDTEIEPNRLAWPLDDPDTIGEPDDRPGYRRVVISGQDLDQLRPLLDEATQITVWTYAGREYSLYFRPLLPDELAGGASE